MHPTVLRLKYFDIVAFQDFQLHSFGGGKSRGVLYVYPTGCYVPVAKRQKQEPTAEENTSNISCTVVQYESTVVQYANRPRPTSSKEQPLRCVLYNP